MTTEAEIRLENARAELEWCLLMASHNTDRAELLRERIRELEASVNKESSK